MFIDYFELRQILGYKAYNKKEAYNIIIYELKIKNTVPELIKTFETTRDKIK